MGLPRSFWRKLKQLAADFLRSSLQEQLYRHLRKDVRRREDLFLFLCFGDLLGFPVPTYITLRLLPFLLPELTDWRKRASRKSSRFLEALEEFDREF